MDQSRPSGEEQRRAPPPVVLQATYRRHSLDDFLQQEGACLQAKSVALQLDRFEPAVDHEALRVGARLRLDLTTQDGGRLLRAEGVLTSLGPAVLVLRFTRYGHHEKALIARAAAPAAAAVSSAAVSSAAVSPAAVSPAVVSPAAVSPAAVSPAAVSPAAVSPGMAVGPGTAAADTSPEHVSPARSGVHERTEPGLTRSERDALLARLRRRAAG